MRLTLLQIMEVTGGGEVGGTQVGNTYSTFHTDSREVASGGVFFALRGAEMDGHRFVPDAIQRGAAAVVVDRRMDIPPGVAEVLVPDTWGALYALASHVLEQVSPLVVGITGSNGKTSTKEMTAAVLGTKYDVLRTTGNLNTETGVPLTILRLESHHTALVLEMGLQRAGDIKRLADLARPKIGVVTNIGVVHMEFFETQEELARSKGELVASLPAEGRAILNADDRHYDLLRALSTAPVSTFGAAHGDYRVSDYRSLAEGSAFTIRTERVRLALAGRHQALNAAAALAAGEAAGVPLPQAVPSLASVKVDHRLAEVVASSGAILVDDAYNASPESMLAAFDSTAERRRGGRLLAVLGHMGELGDIAEDAHRQVGKRAAEVFDEIAVVDSPLGRILADAAGAVIVPDNPSAARWIRDHAQAGDRVLIKGSHSRHLEEVVAELTQ